MGRHRHLVCVRDDGISTVLAGMLEDRKVVAVTLVDVDSGFVLDACHRDPGIDDLELLGAAHADVARAGGLLGGAAGADVVVDAGDGRVHVLHPVPDPHGDRLLLTAVVRGGARAVARAKDQLAAVPVEALTAGPTLRRRPVDGRWRVEPAAPDSPAVPPRGLPGLEPRRGAVAMPDPAPTSAPWAVAMPPGAPASTGEADPGPA